MLIWAEEGKINNKNGFDINVIIHLLTLILFFNAMKYRKVIFRFRSETNVIKVVVQRKNEIKIIKFWVYGENILKNSISQVQHHSRSRHPYPLS